MDVYLTRDRWRPVIAFQLSEQRRNGGQKQNDSAVILPAKCEGSHEFSLSAEESEEGRQRETGGFVTD